MDRTTDRSRPFAHRFRSLMPAAAALAVALSAPAAPAQITLSRDAPCVPKDLDSARYTVSREVPAGSDQNKLLVFYMLSCSRGNQTLVMWDMVDPDAMDMHYVVTYSQGSMKGYKLYSETKNAQLRAEAEAACLIFKPSFGDTFPTPRATLEATWGGEYQRAYTSLMNDWDRAFNVRGVQDQLENYRWDSSRGYAQYRYAARWDKAFEQLPAMNPVYVRDRAIGQRLTPVMTNWPTKRESDGNASIWDGQRGYRRR